MLNFKATVFLIDALVIVLGTLNNLLNLLMKQTVLIVIVFYLSVQPLFSQENLGIPPSPTVASFVTVEKDSVNSSGKIVHNIPLWDMTLGKYSFPISLNYSSSGVRIEETPSYVGTGWNFSAGGVITRSVMDHPDDINNTDHGSGILHTNILNEIETFSNGIDSGGYNESVARDFFRYKINEDNLETRNDTQPDLFYFIFFNYSGKFLFNKNKEIVSLSNDNFKYSYTLDNSDQSLKTFTIIDTNGIEYLFSEREYSKTHYNSNSQWEFLSARVKRQRQLDYYSSWHLTRVITPNGLEMFFDYEDETLSYQMKDSEMGKICETQQCEDANIGDTTYYDIQNNTALATTDFEINTKKIKNITSDFFSIQFNNTQREDLNGGLKLSDIIIKDSNDKIVENYNFKYSYFLSPNIPSSDNYEYKRLKLDAVLKNNKNFENFEYYTNYNLPHRKSNEQDFWGYFNDNNASSLVPKVYTTFNGQSPEYHIFPPLNETVVYEYGNVDRNVNPSRIHMGMLKKITYKTSGYKEFFYEPNDFTLDKYTNGTTTLKGNGVRVNRIEYFDGQKIENLNYTYNSPTTGISSGRVSHLPKFATHIPWNFVYNYRSEYGLGYFSPKRVSWFGLFIPTQYWEWDYSQDPPVQVYRGIRNCFNVGAYGVVLNNSPTNNPSIYFASTTRRFSTTQIPLASNINEALVYEYISVKEGINGEKQYNFNILGGVDVLIPSNYNIENFIQKPSYATNYWYSLTYDGNSLYQNNPPCSQSITVNTVESYTNFFEYLPFVNLSGFSHPYAPKPNWNKYFGQLKNYTYINEDGFKEYKEEYEYDLKGDLVNSNTNKQIKSLKYRLFNRPIGWGISTDNKPFTGPTAWIWSFYDIYYNIGLSPTNITRTNFYNNESLSVIKTYDNEYVYGNFLRKTTHENSSGDILSTTFKYPLDFHSSETSLVQDIFGNWSSVTQNNVYWHMTARNMVNYPIETVKKINGNVVSSQINLFSTFPSQHPSGSILPISIYNLETNESPYNYTYATALSNSSGYLVNKDENMVKKITFDSYYAGNVQQYQKTDDQKTFILWGYNRTKPIAVVEGAHFGEINRWLRLDYGESMQYIQDLSNQDTDEFSEQQLRLWLDNLRRAINNHSQEVRMRYFTHDPLIGVTSMTDSRGETVYYNYDGFNRLKHVKDQDGNILSENDYNYKN